VEYDIGGWEALITLLNRSKAGLYSRMYY